MNPILIGADLVAIALLVFVLFVPRHGRRDLIVAYLGVNVGVLAVSAALSSVGAGVGVGLGLFGVLSLIRLRSEELTQHEIAYYFAALALGLIGGLAPTQTALAAGLMAAVVAALAVGDHPLLARPTQRQQILLDRAYGDPVSVRAHVERVLGGQVESVAILKTDLVNDTTLVDVRHRVPALVGHQAPAEATSAVTR